MQEQRPERLADFRFVELRAFEFGFVRLRDVRLWDHGLAKPLSFAEMPNHLPNFGLRAAQSSEIKKWRKSPMTT